MYYTETYYYADKQIFYKYDGPFTIDYIFKNIGRVNLVSELSLRPAQEYMSWAHRWNYERQLWMRAGTIYPVYLVRNENGVVLSQSTLTGLYREYQHKNIRPYRRFSSKSAYGGLRHPRTTQELRMNYSLDEDDIFYGAKIRTKRKNLPTHWDDYWAHTDKSWKTQSKRNHQYKPV